MKLLLFFILFSQLLFSNETNSNKSFIGLNTGYTYINSSILSEYNLDDNPILYGFEIGYKGNSNLFYSLNYSKLDSDNAAADNFYLSVNYVFDMNHPKYSFYLGALGGWSSVTAKNNLPNSLASTHKKSGNYLCGVQVGYEYMLREDFLLHISYVYSYADLDIHIYGDAQEDSSSRHNVVIGFRYFIDTP